MTSATDGAFSEADRLILAAAAGGRELTDDEIELVVEHVAQAGFDPAGRERVKGVLVGVEWRGRRLQRGDLLPTGEAHYLKHGVAQQEWPPGTSFAAYVYSLRLTVLDPGSGLFVSAFRDKGWQLAVVGRSDQWRGLGGAEWLMVEYRLETGYWVTAFQLRAGLAELAKPIRESGTWLRRPR